MASSLFALIDDIATLLDDVALLSKAAASKTAGVLGDDLALNAQQVRGVAAERELPVVWAVGKGSLWNKVILVPAALLLGQTLPWLITPLLMLGGCYLCFEGMEKLVHAWRHRSTADADPDAALMQALADPAVDLVLLEREKIQGAIRTDFVLSAEIIAITLGMVQDSAWPTQLMVLATVAVTLTLGVYGLVAAIVKLDDLGLYLSRLPVRSSRWKQRLGLVLLDAAPWLMKVLSVLGTAAMFLVGGGMLAQHLPWTLALGAQLQTRLAGHYGGDPGWLFSPLWIGLELLTGMVAGGLVLLGVLAWRGLRPGARAAQG